jgi:hypothetical protein
VAAVLDATTVRPTVPEALPTSAARAAFVGDTSALLRPPAPPLVFWSTGAPSPPPPLGPSPLEVTSYAFPSTTTQQSSATSAVSHGTVSHGTVSHVKRNLI